MSGDSDKRKNNFVQQVARLGKKGLKGEKAKTFDTMVRQYLANVPPTDLEDYGAANLARLATGHLEFAATRKSDSALVRVFNPTEKEHGYHSGHTVIEIINDDMPFLVDSVVAQVNRRGMTAHLIIHPIIKAVRNKAGKLTGILDAGQSDPGAVLESFMHLEVTEMAESRHAALAKAIERVLVDVKAAVQDWRAMRECMAGVIEELTVEPKGTQPEDAREVREFLRWIHDNHFTFLGFREYDIKGTGKNLSIAKNKASGLGVLRDPNTAVFDLENSSENLPADLRRFLTKPSLVLVTKGDHRSTVHRPVPLDVIDVKKIDASGKVVGHRIFVGLFTSVAYNKSPRDIPLLRRRLTKVIETAGFERTSHDGKALTNILETFPRDELFQASDAHLNETAMGILHLQERQRVALFVRADNFRRFISCLVFVPRDSYSTEVGRRLRDVLMAAFDGSDAEYQSQIGDSALARIHYTITTDVTPDMLDKVKAVEAEIAEAARSWTDKLTGVLVERHGEAAGLELLIRYAKAFGPGYQARYLPHEVDADITEIERILRHSGIGMNLYRPAEAATDEMRFKLYHFDHAVPLSDVLPVFEHLGFRVIDEVGPHEIDLSGAGRGKLIIHNFGLRTYSGASVNLDAIRVNFHETFERVWNGEVESDGFNALVACAGLASREVMVLRAMCKYLLQARIPFSQTYMEQTLVANPGVAGDMVKLFQAIFDPANADAAKTTVARIKRRILKTLEAVESADQDRIIRRYLNLLESMLRTNFYQEGGNKPYFSFKLNSQNIDELPLPKPFREIFVYSPRVEGVHLRFGYVARGGLRWSDRREDFRTEILGLVKAQQVKNAVIVPVGSKGGFVLKRLPASNDRAAFLEEGIACYKTFISGLLDITDNIKGANITAPKDTVRLDDDDPYLVVAADKGTATFSDIANGVSIEYGHWLGDAFASGGSQGYDHKKMGITARGGWESVKRHFREIGVDIQSEDFTVVGVGDMGGDVFGNGMLLSKHIKLLGAFNHMHIFVDPNPDPAKSWTERKRLFDTPGTSWEDYNAKLLSKGGAIFSRKSKSLDLSPEIRQCLGITKKSVTPDELMGHLLRAEIDLMWFGGIGTYIKANTESHLDVGDRANDAIRINGAELGCKVIGEGANLGCTQLGRIEYALHGGRLNTDSIDNSAGVDSSDHEVNIKILVDAVMAKGGLTQKSRNSLLASMTDEVGNLVLTHNYRQTQAMSMVENKDVHGLANHQRLMRFLERQGRLDRSVEFLPDDEIIGERALARRGLTRPEISVMLSYAKIWLYDEIMASSMPDDAYLFDDLVTYFPGPLQKKYTKQIGQHRLRREIIASRATNSLVDRAGDTFVLEFMEKTGLGAAAIARAYVIARDALQLRDMWQAIEALDNKVSSDVQMAMLTDINHLLEWVVLWFLRNGSNGLALGANIDAYRTGVQELVNGINKALPSHYVTDAEMRARAYIDQGVPAALAAKIVGLVNLYSACDVVRLADNRKSGVIDVGRVYYLVGSRFRLGRLRAAAEKMESDSHWQQLAIAALIEEIYSHQLALTRRVIDHAGEKDAGKAVQSWIDANPDLVGPTEQLLNELWATEVNDLSMIAVASRQFRAMTEAGG
jgi:glutamate dehydrogenase